MIFNYNKSLILINILVILILLISNFYPKNDENSKTLRYLASKKNFHIGSAVDSNRLKYDREYNKLLSTQLNIITTENEMKFDLIHPQIYKYNFSAADKIIRFANANNQKVRGHTLVWFNRIPDWLEQGDFSKEEMKDILKEHIQTVVGNFKGEIYAWDVVNEAFNDDGTLKDSIWLRAIGEEYIELAFRWAHEADPNALLYYNDYGMENNSNKFNAIYNMLEEFKRNNVPIDGVGYQMHSWIVRDIDYKNVEKQFKELDDLGIEVQITEFDIGIAEPIEESIQTKNNKQAKIYSEVLDVCLKNSNCIAFIMWGITDRYTYRSKIEQPLIFDYNYQPKKAFFSLTKTLEEHIDNQ